MNSLCVVDWNAAAAWVQAIGSMAAIGAAIWIGQRSDQRARALVEDERKRQTDIAVDWAMMRLLRLLKDAEMGQFLAEDIISDATPIKEIKKAWVSEHIVADQDGLSTMHEAALTLDATTAQTLLTAIEAIHSHNDTVKGALSFYEDEIVPSEGKQLLSQVVDSLTQLSTTIRNSIKIIAAIHMRHVHDSWVTAPPTRR